jgi:hypothetical protein
MKSSNYKVFSIYVQSALFYQYLHELVLIKIGCQVQKACLLVLIYVLHFELVHALSVSQKLNLLGELPEVAIFNISHDFIESTWLLLLNWLHAKLPFRRRLLLLGNPREIIKPLVLLLRRIKHHLFFSTYYILL